jgi:hypothetical protein
MRDRSSVNNGSSVILEIGDLAAPNDRLSSRSGRHTHFLTDDDKALNISPSLPPVNLELERK